MPVMNSLAGMKAARIPSEKTTSLRASAEDNPRAMPSGHQRTGCGAPVAMLVPI